MVTVTLLQTEHVNFIACSMSHNYGVSCALQCVIFRDKGSIGRTVTV